MHELHNIYDGTIFAVFVPTNVRYLTAKNLNRWGHLFAYSLLGAPNFFPSTNKNKKNKTKQTNKPENT